MEPPAFPFGPKPGFDEQAAALIDARPPVFSFVFGIPPAGVLEACRARSIVTMGVTTTVEEATALDAAGVDVVVASGFEAGGHRASVRRRAGTSPRRRRWPRSAASGRRSRSSGARRRRWRRGCPVAAPRPPRSGSPRSEPVQQPPVDREVLAQRLALEAVRRLRAAGVDQREEPEVRRVARQVRDRLQAQGSAGGASRTVSSPRRRRTAASSASEPSGRRRPRCCGSSRARCSGGCGRARR